MTLVDSTTEQQRAALHTVMDRVGRHVGASAHLRFTGFGTTATDTHGTNVRVTGLDLADTDTLIREIADDFEPRLTVEPAADGIELAHNGDWTVMVVGRVPTPGTGA